MAHILNTVMGSRTAQTVIKDAEGIEHVAEQAVPVLREVTFMLNPSTPHTLTFRDNGTKLVDGAKGERTVGDDNTPYHEFTDAESAIEAYLSGKV